MTANHIVDALHQELAATGYDKDYDVKLSNAAMVIHIAADQPATVGIAAFTVDPRSERFSAVITVPAGDPRARRYNIVGRLFAVVEVPVPTRSIRAGEVLGEDDIEWLRVRAARVRTNTVSDPAGLIGQQARRSLRAGTMVRQSDVRRPRTVAKGSSVTMIYQTAVMFLSAVGRAQETGTRGDVITVMNSQTRMLVEARILGPDRVAVISPEQLALNEGTAR